MPWLKRSNGRKYFYVATKRNGRCQMTYLGNGPLAELAAAQVEQRRADRHARAEGLRQEEQQHADALAPLGDLDRLSDTVMRAILITCGFRQHDGGEWRKRHDAHRNPTSD